MINLMSTSFSLKIAGNINLVIGLITYVPPEEAL